MDKLELVSDVISIPHDQDVEVYKCPIDKGKATMTLNMCTVAPKPNEKFTISVSIMNITKDTNTKLVEDVVINGSEIFPELDDIVLGKNDILVVKQSNKAKEAVNLRWHAFVEERGQLAEAGNVAAETEIDNTYINELFNFNTVTADVFVGTLAINYDTYNKNLSNTIDIWILGRDDKPTEENILLKTKYVSGKNLILIEDIQMSFSEKLHVRTNKTNSSFSLNGTMYAYAKGDE